MRHKIRKLLTIFLLILAVLSVQIVGFGKAVSAITNGQADGEDHPYVCLVVFDINGSPVWRTTGIVLSPTVVLTAGHGTYGTTGARVWIDSNMQGNTEYPFGGVTSYESTQIYTHPLYRYMPGNGLKEFDYHDVGIVILDEAIPTSVLSRYGALPDLGEVDELGMMASLDAVGYGVQWQKRGFDEDIGLPPGFYPPPPYNSWRWNGLRYFTTVNAVTSEYVISDEFLTLTANPARGKGGTAFGDSGGPILLAGTDTVVAINSFVNNYNCAGITYAQRIDILDIIEWIEGFLE